MSTGEKDERRMSLLLLLPLAVFFFVFISCGASRSVSGGNGGDDSRGKALLKTATSQIGVLYKFGGRTTKGFDCSGLVYWTLTKHGISIERSSFKQFLGGQKVKKGNLQPGDLVFFTTYRAGASHVGFYDGKNGFVHAPKSGKKVQTTSMDNEWWKKRYVGARRYW